MSSVDALAVGKTIDILGVARRGFRKPTHPQKGSGTEVQSLATFFGAPVVLEELVEDRVAVLVTLLEKIRTSDTQHRLGHARILRIVVDQRLPVRTRFSEGTHTQVDGSSAHVFGRREFRKSSPGITIGGVTATHRGEHRFAGRLSNRHCGKGAAKKHKNHKQFSNGVYSRISIGSSMISKLDWISTCGRSVAATLQYFVSESSIACATAFGEIDLPVRMWCTFIDVKRRG